MKSLTFSFSGTLEIGDAVIEVQPGEYRAVLEEFDNGQARVAYVERDETRPGKPPIWLRCQMIDEVKTAIDNYIEDQIAEEQRLLALSVDAEGWRT